MTGDAVEDDSDPDRTREELAFGRPVEWGAEADYGAVFFGPEKSHPFPPLPVGNAESLLENGYLDPGYRHNDAPPAGELIEWARSVQTRYRDHQFEVGLIGYMVSPEREDARVALEGVSVRSPGPVPEDLRREVAKRFSPDLLEVDDHAVVLRWD